MNHKMTFGQRVATEIRGGRSFISAVFSSSWQSMGSFLGSYAAVDPRNTAMRGVIARPVSAVDLANSQPYVRNLCRYQERNVAAVRAGTEGLVACVVGSGIALEPDTGDEATDIKIRKEWREYIRECFVDRTGLYAGQAMGFRDVVTAGELVWRLVIDPTRAADGLIPLCVLPLEPEWLGNSGNNVVGQTEYEVAGVILDNFGRAEAYNLISPNGKVDRVPARLVIHTFERRRALQVRGEPWWAPVLTTLHQAEGLITAELEAAKNTASFSAAITTNGSIPADLDEKGSPVRDLHLGQVMELQPGEDVKLLGHTRPSQQIAPFWAMLQGNIAGAMRISTRWLNRDLSQTNYSSMNADNHDSGKLLGPVTEFVGHGTAGKLYKAVLPYLALRANVDVPRSNYRLLPDGGVYVDPVKDLAGAAGAIAAGLSTQEVECAKRGRDWKDVMKQRKVEIEHAKSLGIAIITPDGDAWGDEEAVAAMAEAQKPPAVQAAPAQA